jgi:peptidylprolyl isomerase
LKITEIEEGEGSLAKKGDIMFIVYTAWYVDGDQFDSYQDRDTPYRFRLGFEQVLAGLDEGVATMRPGGKRMLVLPPELAFGKEAQGLVPADTWVKFEVELVKIEPGPIPPTPWSDVGYEIAVAGTGLQYVGYVIGEGNAPAPDSEIIVHYSGFLDDGTVFDSSYYRGAPIRFSLRGGELIPGWIEGIATMREGGKRKLIIPPYLAYGEAGYRKSIPPHATLIYDIELLTVREEEP